MGEGAASLRVEVVYALPNRCWRWQGRLPAGSTVGDAILESGFSQAFPDASVDHQVGVFGVVIELGQPLKDRDRVEIYRPLACDPMEARRRRAGQAPGRHR